MFPVSWCFTGESCLWKIRPTWYAFRISRIECECDPSLCHLFATAVIYSQTTLVTINKDQWLGTRLSTMDNNFFHQVFPEYTWYCRSKYVKCYQSFRNGSSHLSDIHYNIMFVHQEFTITCYKQLSLYSQSLKKYQCTHAIGRGISMASR